MPSSLDSLVRNLSELEEVNRFFPSKHADLLTRKGIFPYEYITDWNKLEETTLPPKEIFYSRLNQSGISQEDYEHAVNVWNTFQFKTLGQYADHNLLLDTLQLCSVFENFRTITLKNHKLDICHYYTAPGLTFDEMLKFTNVRLQLLTDYDMILLLERGIRGGICQVSHRYAHANNHYMTDYDANKESTFISYQDCTNLYGKAMTMSLPYGGFQWAPPETFSLESTHDDDDDVGYILDVDLEYPSQLHKLHNDLPFLPETITINKHKKLVPHLGTRSNNVVHYVTLRQALEHGLKLVKINRVLKFNQSKWLSPYVEFNVELRNVARNDFEKEFFKLMNNAIFGKTMENIRKRVNIQLVSSARKIERLVARPDFINRTIIGENLAAIHMAKKCIVFNKPIYVGMSILDLSKTVMYNYHYNIMLPKYGVEKLKLCYVDTDSFTYFLKTQDFFNDMTSLLEYMDTSDYPANHPCYSIKNRKVMGTFKDEVAGKIIRGFVGLRAKMYFKY
ncbi:uncharacterized protein [Rhodnius prolixus]|uniref:uncharacterized protein n=1 Tax=Rhodnius prolixus TaxID=13249 RepID=UPI003D18F37C